MNFRFVSFLTNTLLLWESRRSPALETESNKKESVAEKIMMICVFFIFFFVDMMQPEIIEIKRMKKICHILFEEKKTLTNYPFLEFIILKNQTKPTLMEAKLNIFEPKKTLSHTRKKKRNDVEKSYLYLLEKHTHTTIKKKKNRTKKTTDKNR